MEKGRGHTPHLVPQKALGLDFKIMKSFCFPDTDFENIPIRIFIPDAGKVCEVMTPDKILRSPFHRRYIGRIP
jgi:hypothetical protein